MFSQGEFTHLTFEQLGFSAALSSQFCAESLCLVAKLDIVLLQQIPLIFALDQVLKCWLVRW